MSLLGDILSGGSFEDAPATDPDLIKQIELQHEIDFDNALDFFSPTIRWLSGEIADQFLLDRNKIEEHLFGIPDEHVRYLVEPFGWVFLAHHAARALGYPNPPQLKIRRH
ncbi:hypothetical protein KFK14_19700 [Sphingobium phenoxybenzoativorans]|uniref:Uncharacterized protein n=1 Tax=Sphingobium phenoxybenzoativorans TaxID=1592790 RepID=A0A975K838_9SPHN|nr:hypothetical protein [Sphingobium phenoxybenzoativorans]QUT05197.1 hypothetical protein KFK14_19700 [Sphingobium phenoxybenzoativorans]